MNINLFECKYHDEPSRLVDAFSKVNWRPAKTNIPVRQNEERVTSTFYDLAGRLTEVKLSMHFDLRGAP